MGHPSPRLQDCAEHHCPGIWGKGRWEKSSILPVVKHSLLIIYCNNTVKNSAQASKHSSDAVFQGLNSEL